MLKKKWVAATRKSPLAMQQTQHVIQRLQNIHPEMEIDILGFTTTGDTMLDNTLFEKGGKSLFVKELEHALMQKHADFAVHSMKDVPIALPDGLMLAAIMERENPYDAFVSNHYAALDALPLGARVGTASLRRSAQIKAYRADLQIGLLRGNVNTRLNKLDDGQFDAIILAVAGLNRLGFTQRIKEILPLSICLPAVGQGAIGIECRTEDKEMLKILAELHHSDTADCVYAERAMNAKLEGGCHAPIAGYASIEKNELFLQGMVSSLDGQKQLFAECRKSRQAFEWIGNTVAMHLLEQGAEVILRHSE